MARHVTFDGMSLPIEKNLVVLDDDTEEDSLLEGAGITWDKFEDDETVTVELKIRGLDPLHFSVTEDPEGNLTVILPDIPVRR